MGYEGLVQDQLLDFLAANRVAVLLDVRAVPLSRKAGFSKRILAASLSSRSIAYMHEPALGTPKSGRDAARAGRTEAMRAVFSEHMRGETAQQGLASATRLARNTRVCLLCFERAAHDCHRSIVASSIAAATGQLIRHL